MMVHGSSRSRPSTICLISLSVITLHWQTSIGGQGVRGGGNRGIEPGTNMNVNVRYCRGRGGATPPYIRSRSSACSCSRRAASTATEAATRCAVEKNSRWMRNATVTRLAAIASHSLANQATIGTAK